MSNCILTIGSATQTIKATNLLNSYSIPATTVKVGSKNAVGGCVYGIEYNCLQKSNVKRILEGAEIKFEAFKE